MFYQEHVMRTRHKELLKEATYQRRISQSKPRPTRRKYTYHRFLAWLGSRLCAWGYLLRERSGEVEAITASQAVKCSI